MTVVEAKVDKFQKVAQTKIWPVHQNEYGAIRDEVAGFKKGLAIGAARNDLIWVEAVSRARWTAEWSARWVDQCNDLCQTNPGRRDQPIVPNLSTGACTIILLQSFSAFFANEANGGKDNENNGSRWTSKDAVHLGKTNPSRDDQAIAPNLSIGACTIIPLQPFSAFCQNEANGGKYNENNVSRWTAEHAVWSWQNEPEPRQSGHRARVKPAHD
jgi:hypothetical protein